MRWMRLFPIGRIRSLAWLCIHSVRDATRVVLVSVSETAAIARQRLLTVESDRWTDRQTF